MLKIILKKGKKYLGIPGEKIKINLENAPKIFGKHLEKSEKFVEKYSK